MPNDSDAGVGPAISALIADRMASRNVTVTALGQIKGVSTGKTLSRRIQTGEGWEIDELLRMLPALDIHREELAGMLFPESGMAEMEATRLTRQVQLLQEEIALIQDGKYDAQTVVRDVVQTGHWAAGAIPNMAGPTPTKKVLSAVHIAIAPLEPSDATYDELRASLTKRLPSIARRSIWLSARDTIRPNTPGLRGVAHSDDNVLDLSVPVYDKNRDPVDVAERTVVRHRGRGVLVVATTTASWATPVGALIGRSLGWGVHATRGVARSIKPPLSVDGDATAGRTWLRLEADRQLRNRLFEDSRESDVVYSHWGWSEVTDEGSRHPLVEAIAASKSDVDFPELPFVVLLREKESTVDESASIANAGQGTRNTGTGERIRASRDALYEAVLTMPKEQRLIIEVDAAGGDGPVAHSEALWMRSVIIAQKVLVQLLGSPAAPRITDRETSLLMSAAPGWEDLVQ